MRRMDAVKLHQLAYGERFTIPDEAGFYIKDRDRVFKLIRGDGMYPFVECEATGVEYNLYIGTPVRRVAK